MTERITSEVLARKLFVKYRLTLLESRQILDLIFRTIADGLKHDMEVRVTGFGRFFVQHKPERMVVHPKLGKMVLGKPKVLPHICWSSVLTRELNKKRDG